MKKKINTLYPYFILIIMNFVLNVCSTTNTLSYRFDILKR